MALNAKKPGAKPVAAKREMTDEAFERVSAGAMDHRPAAEPEPELEPVKGRKMGNKLQITFTLTADQLRRSNRWAKKLNIGRAGLINLALSELFTRLEKDEK